MTPVAKQHDFVILLYYKFTPLEYPERLVQQQRALCEELGMKGRILISPQGINGTVEGTPEQVQAYMNRTHEIDGLQDLLFKQSQGTGSAFPKLAVKLRDEIVTTNIDDVYQYGPHTGKTGKYVSAEELHSWFHPAEGEEPKEFYMVDMRNDYEYSVGHFKNAIIPENLKNFRDLKDTLPHLEHLKNKTIVTYCTGGIRCEVASGFLLDNGFNDVYQLEDGIVTYMEKFPNEDFLGKLYVFDSRVIMGFNTESSEHKVIGKCSYCGVACENFHDFYNKEGVRRHMIVCDSCIETEELVTDMMTAEGYVRRA